MQKTLGLDLLSREQDRFLIPQNAPRTRPTFAAHVDNVAPLTMPGRVSQRVSGANIACSARPMSARLSPTQPTESHRAIVRNIARRDPEMSAALEKRLNAHGTPPLGDLVLSERVVGSHVTAGKTAELRMQDVQLWLPGWLPVPLSEMLLKVTKK